MVPKCNKPGERVLISGVYRASHGWEHCPAQDLIAVSGERFRKCAQCGDQVRYSRICAAPRMHDSPQFTEETHSPCRQSCNSRRGSAHSHVMKRSAPWAVSRGTIALQ